MPRIEGNIVSRNEKKKIVTISFINKEGKLKKKDFTVASEELWELMKGCSNAVTIEYKEAEPYPVINRVISKLNFVIYGFNSKIGEMLKDKGSFSAYTKDALALSAIPAMFLSGSELDIFILAILIALLVIFSIYYFLLIPILILILSIFTMGEAIRMLRRKIFTIDIDSSDQELCKKIREIVKVILLNKGALTTKPERCLTQEYRKYIEYFKGIYEKFWTGMALQGLGIIMLGILYGVTKFFKLIPGDIFFYLEIVFAIIFAVGFLLSVWAGLSRKFSEVPLKLKYM